MVASGLTANVQVQLEHIEALAHVRIEDIHVVLNSSNDPHLVGGGIAESKLRCHATTKGATVDELWRSWIIKLDCEGAWVHV